MLSNPLDEKKNIDLYFASVKHKQNFDDIINFFNNLDVDLEDFKNFCDLELKDLEKEVIWGHYIDEKSLKNISIELNYSYSYIRKIFIEGKNKMSIILNMYSKKKLNDFNSSLSK